MKNFILGLITLFKVNSYQTTYSNLYNSYSSFRTRKLSSQTISYLSSIPSNSPTYNTEYPTNIYAQDTYYPSIIKYSKRNSKKVRIKAKNIVLLIFLIIQLITLTIGFSYCCWIFIFCRCKGDKCFSS